MNILPELTLLALVLVGAGFTIVKNDEEKITKRDWLDFALTSLVFTILYYGGLFAP